MDFEGYKNRFETGKKFCKICKVEYVSNRNHCHDCGVCIDEYDHHCPWTSQCIGKGNLCCFYLFLVSTCFSMIYCYIVGIQYIIINGKHDDK